MDSLREEGEKVGRAVVGGRAERKWGAADRAPYTYTPCFSVIELDANADIECARLFVGLF